MTDRARTLARELIASVLKPVSMAGSRRLALQLEEALNADEPAPVVEATDDSVARFALVEIE